MDSSNMLDSSEYGGGMKFQGGTVKQGRPDHRGRAKKGNCIYRGLVGKEGGGGVSASNIGRGMEKGGVKGRHDNTEIGVIKASDQSEKSLCEGRKGKEKGGVGRTIWFFRQKGKGRNQRTS